MWTRKATLLTAAGLTITALGVVTRSPAALAAGLVALAFVLVNRVLFVGNANVGAKRQLEIVRVFEGDGTRVDLTIDNPGKRLLFAEVRDRLPRQVRVRSGKHYDYVAIPRASQAKLSYDLAAPLLGVYEVGPTDLRLEDPFGLFYEERTLADADTLWSLPRIEDLRKAALLSRLPLPLMGEHQVNRPGDGFDFFALREYVPGDTMRRINWKASARSGKMMVNQMERTTAAEVTVLVDARAILNVGEEDKSPRGLVARATASIVDFLYKTKDHARVVLYSDHVKEIEPMPAERMIPFIMETMAELQPKGDCPLGIAVSDVLPSLKQQTPVIIISPLLDDPTVIQAASVLLANGMIITVISPRPPSLPGLDPEFAAALMAERANTLRELQGFGSLVIDLAPEATLAAAMEKGGMVTAR